MFYEARLAEKKKRFGILGKKEIILDLWYFEINVGKSASVITLASTNFLMHGFLGEERCLQVWWIRNNDLDMCWRHHNFLRRQLSTGNVILLWGNLLFYSATCSTTNLIPMVRSRKKKKMSSDNILLTFCLHPYFYPLFQNLGGKHCCNLWAFPVPVKLLPNGKNPS